MLSDRQKFDVIESKLLHVFDQPRCQIAIGSRLSPAVMPGSEVDLVNGHRLLPHIPGPGLGHVGLVFPGITRSENPRSRARRFFRPTRQRVGFHQEPASAGHDFKFVEGATGKTRKKNLENTRIAATTHRKNSPIPATIRTDDTHPAGIGSPHGERKAGHTVLCARTGTEALPELLMGSFADEVEIKIRKRRTKAIRVIALPGFPVVRGKTDAVGLLDGHPFDPKRECSRAEARHFKFTARAEQKGLVGNRVINPNHRTQVVAAAAGVRPEKKARVAQLALAEPLDLPR